MFAWVLSRFIEILIKNIFKNLKTLKKLNHALGDTLLHYKTKNEIKVITSSCFKMITFGMNMIYNNLSA